jgi:beta-glucosidase
MGKASIEALAARGILNGTSKTEFSPAKSITRAEFLYLLVRSLGISTAVDSNFTDVKKDAYYYNEIGAAKKLGITQGSGGLFHPNDKITRQDAMVLTVRAIKILGEQKPQNASDDLLRFNDRNLLASYAADSMEYAVETGLINGSGGCVNPLGNATRAEAAVILYRLFKAR